MLGINPFDQPDVQAAKDKTNEVLAAGEPELEPRGDVDELLAQAGAGDYVAIQAFVDPAREDELAPLVARARETGCVVTSGLGPRYLHSTGQLHKGGPNTGLFVQVVDETGDELPIPGRDFGFGRLLRSQAAGDFAALEERGRRVIRIRLEDVVPLPATISAPLAAPRTVMRRPQSRQYARILALPASLPDGPGHSPEPRNRYWKGH